MVLWQVGEYIVAQSLQEQIYEDFSRFNMHARKCSKGGSLRSWWSDKSLIF